ncbi:hypothetical protein HCN44_011406 [Aphidius gifuensis]|uniref:RRM domain-containing protein n=1 Tax=Aphidius gifuensis TaxID=684658 RepID=A0A834XWZ9_APHGI|nr:hypothetical protein HCN44_011406 [Aphidius gifuensis]
MSLDPNIPLPLEPIKSSAVEDRRLWVGNLDLRINELISGQPRGYAFVTYTNVDAAISAKNILNNAKLGSKNVVLRWAHNVSESDMKKEKPKIEITALAGAKKEDVKISRQTTIQAIEAKLKLMEERQDDFDLNKPQFGITVSEPSQQSTSDCQKTSSNRYRYQYYRHYQNRPYSRSRPRR